MPDVRCREGDEAECSDGADERDKRRVCDDHAASLD